MKVKFLIEEDDITEWRDFWIDSNLISGFYIPTIADGDDLCINVLYDGDFMTFLQEGHLVKYLENRFVISE